jgi:hypothetical protein
MHVCGIREWHPGYEGVAQVVAVGVAEATDPADSQPLVPSCIEIADAVVLFTGLDMDRHARRHHHESIVSALQRRDVPCEVIDEVAALGSNRRNLSMFEAMDRVACALLDQATRNISGSCHA